VRAGACPAVVPRHSQSPPMFYVVPQPIGSACRPAFPDSQYEGPAPEKNMPAKRTDRLLPPVSEAPTTEQRQGGQVAVMWHGNGTRFQIWQMNGGAPQFWAVP
jgi:hypothetical protein